MDELELCNLIDHNIENGVGADNGDLSTTRQTILDRYLGELYGNEKDGESKVTTREVFETVEWAMPSIMRVFESGDRVVEFTPEGPDDEEGAEQETDAVNHVYQKDNNGFVVTHNIVKSCLLNPNSYVKVYREESEKVETEHYENMGEQELMLLLNDPEVELVGQELTETGYSVEIKRNSKRGRNVVQPLPEEEVIVHNNHAELDLDDCEFVAHIAQETRSYLIGLGYSAKDLDNITSGDEYLQESQNRRTFSDENEYDDESHKALKKYTVEECYLLCDYDGDGMAERRRVVKIGNKIFENEEIDYQPIASAASILMPFKHTGYSLAQAVIDLQDIKTFFMRQTNTNMAKVNNPRTFINKDVNLSDMLSNRTNGIVRVNNGNNPAMSASVEPIQPIIGQVMPLFDLIDRQKEARTGISHSVMNLDPNVLAQATEGAFMGAVEKADQRIEFIVRVLAETIFKQVFLKLHHLILSHGDTKWMKLNGQWVMVNPSEWKKRESMTVTVGLGMGNKNQKMMSAQMIIGQQDKDMMAGLPLVDPQKLYNARRLLVENSGEKNVDKYFINPSMVPPQPQQPPQPDPNMMMIQANQQIEADKRQVEMAKLQQAGQIEAAKMQFQQMEVQRQDHWKGIEMQYKAEIENLSNRMTQSKNDDDAANKALSARIKQLEVQLDDAANDEKLLMDKYRADLDSQTKITLKEMDNAESVAPLVEQNQQVINESLSALAGTLAAMNQPKIIVRDQDGSPIVICCKEDSFTILL